MEDNGLVSIGDVSRRTGVAISALRYYDDIGLAPPTLRISGNRGFDEEAIGRVNFIVRAKEAGFTLDEIGAILDDTAGVWPKLVKEKLSELRQRRIRLDTMIEMIEEIRDCSCEAVARCPAMTGQS